MLYTKSVSPCFLFLLVDHLASVPHKVSNLKMDVHAEASSNSQFSLGISPWRHHPWL